MRYGLVTGFLGPRKSSLPRTPSLLTTDTSGPLLKASPLPSRILLIPGSAGAGAGAGVEREGHVTGARRAAGAGPLGAGPETWGLRTPVAVPRPKGSDPSWPLLSAPQLGLEGALQRAGEGTRRTGPIKKEKELSFDVKIASSGVVESSVCPRSSGDQMKEPWTKLPPRALPETGQASGWREASASPSCYAWAQNCPLNHGPGLKRFTSETFRPKPTVSISPVNVGWQILTFT
ncbi:uncharacterized protein LOC115281688 [Suricata suricatta]|uniref:uncharacterized protein LOC115281688 n=1 Tax=Suricata suricatta TaxID=37032 RepID=UPI0011558B8B|nr:uncharacterized protein LOC115281688 [Suricata suricatta]